MDIFGSVEKSAIMVIGDVMLDRFWWGTVDRVSPEAPVPVVKLNRTSVAVGGAANVAANVAGLGASPKLIGIVGNDAEGEMTLDAMKLAGVSDHHIFISPSRPTTVKTRIIAHSQQVTRVDQETVQTLARDEERAIIANINDLIDTVDAVVISDYAKGIVTANVLSTAIAKASAAGIPLLVDPKGKAYDKYRGATILTPNRHEAGLASSISESDVDFVSRAGRTLLECLGVKAVLITRGEDGMTLFRDGGETHFGTAARKVYDVTGAGDTVIATLAVSLAAGADMEDATRLANLAAGIVVETVGTARITIGDLKIAVEQSRARQPLSHGIA